MFENSVRHAGRRMMQTNGGRRAYKALNIGARRALDGRVWSGPGRGLRFRGGDTAGYVLGISEPTVQQVITEHLRAGGVFFDVGANIGFMSVLARRLVGPDGEVHCFEPLPENVIELRRNLRLNSFDATVHEVALSAEPGMVEMAAASALRGRAHLVGVGTAEEEVDLTHHVRAVTMDSLDLPAPDLVKIDVEGAETLVLRGMRETLARHRPVLVIEIHPGQDVPVRALLEEAGYRVTVLDDGGMPHFLAAPGR